MEWGVQRDPVRLESASHDLPTDRADVISFRPPDQKTATRKPHGAWIRADQITGIDTKLVPQRSARAVINSCIDMNPVGTQQKVTSSDPLVFRYPRHDKPAIGEGR